MSLVERRARWLRRRSISSSRSRMVWSLYWACSAICWRSDASVCWRSSCAARRLPSSSTMRRSCSPVAWVTARAFSASNADSRALSCSVSWAIWRSRSASCSARLFSACARSRASASVLSLTRALSWAISASFCAADVSASWRARATAASTALSRSRSALLSRAASSRWNSVSRTWRTICAYSVSSTWNTSPQCGHLISAMGPSVLLAWRKSYPPHRTTIARSPGPAVPRDPPASLSRDRRASVTGLTPRGGHRVPTMRTTCHSRAIRAQGRLAVRKTRHSRRTMGARPAANG